MFKCKMLENTNHLDFGLTELTQSLMFTDESKEMNRLLYQTKYCLILVFECGLYSNIFIYFYIIRNMYSS